MKFLNKKGISIILSLCSALYFSEKKSDAKINLSSESTRAKKVALMTILGVLGMSGLSLMIYKLLTPQNSTDNQCSVNDMVKIDGVKEIIEEWADHIMKTCDKSKASQIIIDKNSNFFNKFKHLLKDSKYNIDNMVENFVPVFKIEIVTQTFEQTEQIINKQQNKAKKISGSKNTQKLFLYLSCEDNVGKYFDNEHLLCYKECHDNDFESD